MNSAMKNLSVAGLSCRHCRHTQQHGKLPGKILACVLLAMVVVTASKLVSAAPITFFSPDSATATNTNLGIASPTHLINLSGLSSIPVTLDNIGTILHSEDDFAGWRGGATALPITLTFDFNSSQRIDYIGLWQWTQSREGTRDFQLTFWDGPSGTGNQIGSLYSAILDTGAGGDNSIPLNGRAFDVGIRTGVDSVTMEQWVSSPLPILQASVC